MEAKKLRKEAKILLTDLAADRNREDNLKKYTEMTASAFSSYARIKLSMNLFTLSETELEKEAEGGERNEDYWIVRNAVKSITDGVPTETMRITKELRDLITARMKVLTAYTDFFEQHEYILNRKEAGILGQTEEVSPEQLAEEAFSYVFSDQDKMVVNTRIQSVVEQLPVRMTKQRFYDILSEAIALYKGGELSVAKDFIHSISDAALLTLPEGFDETYPELKSIRDFFDSVTYKDLDEAEYLHLNDELDRVTEVMEEKATRDLLLQEIVNDILIVQLTAPFISKEYTDDRAATAEEVLGMIVSDKADLSAEQFDRWFLSLEGAQEEAYETLLALEGSLEAFSPELDEAAADALRQADLLTSTSLFMDLDRKEITVVEEKAEESVLEEMKKTLFAQFDEAFSKLSKEEKRSRMAKVLSMVPVFFNSRDEIREYFLYALENCRDDSELTAVSHIIRSMMLPEA